MFPHLQGYDVIASPLQRPRWSLASVLADLSCLHQVRVMLVGLVVVNGRLTQQAQQFSSSYTTCLRTAQPRMAATRRRAKLSMKCRVSKGYLIRIHSITSAAGFQQISQYWRLKWCLNYYTNRWRKHAEAIPKHSDPVCSACVFFTRVSLPKCWFWLVSRPRKAKNNEVLDGRHTVFWELHTLQRMLELRIRRISWCRKWWSRCCRTWEFPGFHDFHATGGSRYQYHKSI